MKKVYQTKTGINEDTGEMHGNCYAACMASIFELSLDEVPDIDPNLEWSEWLAEWNQWLGQRGLYTISMCADDYVMRRHGWPKGWSIGTVPSTRGDWTHAVVCFDGMIVHDPHPSETALGAEHDLIAHDIFISIHPNRMKIDNCIQSDERSAT